MTKMKNLANTKLQSEWEALVETAMRDQKLSKMRPVVEKELLHYEIFAALDKEGLLKNLVFQGGTCLRLCHGSYRYSEDLDFAGGVGFNAQEFESIKQCLEEHMISKFGLDTAVKPPKHLGATPDNVPVAKWTMAVVTAPANRAIPKQKIKIEVAAVAAHSREMVPMIGSPQVGFGQRPILVAAETREEIMADKLIAFPTSLYDNLGRPQGERGERIRFRDLWDLAWLAQNRIQPNLEFVERKILDYGINNYEDLVRNAIERIPEIVQEPHFANEMQRFIDSETFAQTLARPEYLEYMKKCVVSFYEETLAHLGGEPDNNTKKPETKATKHTKEVGNQL